MPKVQPSRSRRDPKDRTALRRVARRVGIEPRSTDALGTTRNASDDALRALVAALGLPADPDAAARQIEQEEKALPLGLAPVHLVHAEDSRPVVPLRLPCGTRKIVWSCRLEDGSEHRGQFVARDPAVALPLPAGLPLGYHRLAVEAGAIRAELDLIVAPAVCWLPPQLGRGARRWGLTCQLYSLRSSHDWGIGDLSDLAELAAATGSCGAAVLGVNPLHARFAAEPLHYSPYSPSSRFWLDHLAIDAAAVPGFAEDRSVGELVAGDWFGATHWAARSAELIDYGAVAACKRAVLEALWRRFRDLDLDNAGGARSEHGQDFRRFQHRGGGQLVDFATFEALHEHFCRDGHGFSWHGWPSAVRNPRSPETAEFAAARRDRVEFFQFLQWEADRQLAAAAAAGRDAGLSIGLYRDLAVGANPNGAEAWADQEIVVSGAAIGAPPDRLAPAGQNWGLAPVNPRALRRCGFAPFVAALRANMRHAGVLRIDHAMQLRRLYWIPNGMPATEGCYVNYPLDALVRLVALESHRQCCAVIGEDLGTVPRGFRGRMRASQVLSYRVMRFERRPDGSFVAPGEYPPLAAAAAATHDLATLEGFWLGRDIAWRRRLGLYPDAAAEAAETAERRRDRRLLLTALAAEGLLTAEDCGGLLSEAGEPAYRPTLGDAVQRWLARSRARLLLVQLEDVVGESEQANLPGTTDAHPNWRRRLRRTLEEIADGGALARLAGLIEKERSRPGGAGSAGAAEAPGRKKIARAGLPPRQNRL